MISPDEARALTYRGKAWIVIGLALVLFWALVFAWVLA